MSINERTREEVREATEIIVKAVDPGDSQYDGRLMRIPPRRVVPKPNAKAASADVDGVCCAG